MNIREYRPKDETGWVRCRVLSFLDTAYFDNVLREKESYDHPSIELVAVEDEQVIGLLDIEYEVEQGTVCSKEKGLGGMIWHMAVHPDYRRKGVGFALLQEAERRAKKLDLSYLEAWTRDDRFVQEWYEKQSFTQFDAYLHVFFEGQEEMKQDFQTNTAGLIPILGFAHYVGEDQESIRNQHSRVHECVMYAKDLEVV